MIGCCDGESKPTNMMVVLSRSDCGWWMTVVMCPDGGVGYGYFVAAMVDLVGVGVDEEDIGFKYPLA
ncbi:hypothetical protein CTI12_AA190100 [Artemisia annua]|uniref:Uncharacterized protein n=1 Tax=Artemisia annua TaxID=35608 RepID=A0A2U1P5R4_ARTAN|nr:hypothetical protein CTI12_AA190100 [Artemisia annua]